MDGILVGDATQSQLLVTTVVVTCFYFGGGCVSFWQWKRREELHQRNSVMLHNFFQKTLNLSKFPLLTGIAMEVRVMFFIVQYIYVSSYVDWFGLISINILEGFGYLLFVSSYTILISFFGALPILNAELRGSKLQEGKGSAMVRRSQQRGSVVADDKKNVSNTRANGQGDRQPAVTFTCLALTANFWLYLAELFFICILIFSYEQNLGTVETVRKISFSVFYLFYIIDLQRRGYDIKRSLQTMHLPSESLEFRITATVFACSATLLLQIISMLLRALLEGAQTVPSVSMLYTNATIFNVSQISTGEMYETKKSFSTLSSDTDISILGNRTQIYETQTWTYTNMLRQFGLSPLLFFFIAEWIPAMYLLYVMAPTTNGARKQRKGSITLEEMSKVLSDESIVQTTDDPEAQTAVVHI